MILKFKSSNRPQRAGSASLSGVSSPAPCETGPPGQSNLDRKILASQATKISKYLRFATYLAAIVSIGCITDLHSANASVVEEVFLEGIGYREQELQQAKGTKFADERPRGVSIASFGGGTNIFIKGVGLALNPQSNAVLFRSENPKGEFSGPKLTEDDAFLSSPDGGFVTYRTSAPHVILGLAENLIDTFDNINFVVSVLAVRDTEPVLLECKPGTEAWCTIKYQRSYTPVLHYINPPVVFFDSETEFVFDPKSTTNAIADLLSDELPFINGKIGGALVDFSENVDFQVGIRHWTKNFLKGIVGDQPVSAAQDISMLWETGNVVQQAQTIKTCNYENEECYKAKTVPVIFSVSESTGFTTGGQNLTFTGFGFNNKAIDVKIDQTPCIVTSYGDHGFDCQVQSKAAPSATDLAVVGQHGIRRMFWKGGNWKVDPPQISSLATQFETRFNEGDNTANQFKGWFVPPATTNYRFYMACDDYCELRLGKAAPGTATDAEKILDVNSYSGYRFYRKENGQTMISEWQALEKGVHYYIETDTQEGGGDDYFTLSVEIEKADTKNHHHTMKELVNLALGVEDIKETTRITIENPDDGEFRLVFTHPTTFEKTVSGAMASDCSAGAMRQALYDFFARKSPSQSNISVVRKFLDAAGAVTEVRADAKKYVYDVQLAKLVRSMSMATVQVLRAKGAAAITVELPDVVQLSSPPIGGHYKIQCADPANPSQYTLSGQLDAWSNVATITRALYKCAKLRDVLRVYHVGGVYSDWSVGANYVVEFTGMNEQPPILTIVTDVDSPLTGNNIQLKSEVVVPFGTNLFYEPIPFEMLKTYETKPQVIVNVGEMPAVCKNLTCDFTYTAPVGEITGFTYDEGAKVLVITGTDFPALSADIQRVWYAMTECTIDQAKYSQTNIECTLTKNPTCGSHKPKVVTRWGLVPHTTDLADQTVLCSISGMQPFNALNLLGGDNITITGTNFPHQVEGSTFELKFDDTQATACQVQTTMTTTLVCLTTPFDAAVSLAGTYKLGVTINGQVVTHTVDATMKDNVKKSSMLAPSSVSPVLKTRVTITLDADFPFTLDKDHFTVNATDTTNSTYVRYMNVVEVDDTNKKLVTMFGGAKSKWWGDGYSGRFQISIRHRDYGLVDTKDQILSVESITTDYSPKVGSIFGGTLLTITGTNYGKVPSDNPVQISFNGALGSQHCLVKTISATQITCRIGTGYNKRQINEAKATVVVFQKTSEEAQCDYTSDPPVCQFTYTSTLPIVKTMVPAFDATTNQYRITVTGTGFVGTASTVSLEIANVAQTTISATSTEVVFAITSIPSDAVSKAMWMYFPVGVPEGHDVIQGAFTLAPKLTQISPNIGSTGGTLIQATVHGVGTATEGLQLVDADGKSICEKLTITAYSQVECFTKGGAAGTKLAISAKLGETTTGCAASDATKCEYTAQDESTMPQTASVAKTETTIVFTGINFITSGYTGRATFMGIAATSVTIDSATQATATWTDGVPTTSSEATPELQFSKVYQTITITAKLESFTTACTQFDGTSCEYAPQEVGTMPRITSVAADKDKADTTVVLKGVNFFTSEYSRKASFMSVDANEVTNSATRATATWTAGVPTTSGAETPELVFTKDSFMIIDSISTQKLANPASLTSSTTGLECSFEGGCDYKVQATGGFTTMLKTLPADNYIKICEKKCVITAADSVAGTAWCKVPSVSTTYSNENFKIEVPTENLNSGKYFGTKADQAPRAFDNDPMTLVNDNNKVCNVGMEFKKGYIGAITQVKYFLKEIDNRASFVGNLAFEGSQDGTTYTALFTADQNVHEGWNYYKWEEASTAPKYRFYRFAGLGAANGACKINEVTLTGTEVIDSSTSSHDCDAELILNGGAAIALSSVKYKGSLTPLLTAISPRFGTVVGGTEVTFTGTGFDVDTSKYSIVIDGINCPVSAATITAITCTTGKRPFLPETSLVMTIAGKGKISTQGLVFKYVNLWSADTTWGGEFAPMDMETVYIPKGLNLLVDVDRTPKLNAVLVEGSLLFMPSSNPETQRYFDAMYVFVTGGYMEVGTEEFPYTSKLTITMHGAISDPYIPIYGNKVIGCRFCTLEMHGPKRTPTWTELDTTVEAGGTQITLHTAVDWVVGEQIALASSSYSGREGEKRYIKAINKDNANKPVITLDEPVEFKHFAGRETFGSDFIDMRTEVGLLTRNVKFRGDPETSTPYQYGATMFLHSTGDDSLQVRLSYIELEDVGQAFKLGRYAIHFHMIGAVHKSYAIGLATHQGFNRAFTIHGTHYLRLEDNVAFKIKGHTVFIEDAIETKNNIKNNLIMNTQRSWSLLNTDQTPACFWITNPYNNFINNHCGGSDRYAYWYDLQVHAMGPSANNAVCPENMKVGVFKDNHAHSCGRYGLRIFHNMIPRKYPCKAETFDWAEDKKDEPYHNNPAITATFDGLVSWKNRRNGAIAERVGDVRFTNFKTADNLEAGIEFSLTQHYGDDTTRIDGALVIGRTSNTEIALDRASPHGVIAPRTENLLVKNVKFYNFNFNSAAALGSCSHCQHGAATDSGARQTSFEGLSFDDATVPRRIRYNTPLNAIFYDRDGSLTGLGPKSWATPYFLHNMQPGCTGSKGEDKFDGIICDSSVQVRRIAFPLPSPAHRFKGMGLKVLRYDDPQKYKDTGATAEQKVLDLAEYEDTKSNYGTVLYKDKKDPEGWAAPFVTGHKYKIHWGITGLDWDAMTLDPSERWEPTDKSIYFVHNFTDVRATIDVKLGGLMVNEYAGEGEDKKTTNVIPALEADYKSGQSILYPEDEVREFHWIVNDVGTRRGPATSTKRLRFDIHRCFGACFVPTAEGETEAKVRYWSKPESWDYENTELGISIKGKVPEAGESFVIQKEWNMQLDVADPPAFDKIEVNGILRVKNTMDFHLQVKKLLIRGGEFRVGSAQQPYTKNGKITLWGGKEEPTIAIEDQGIEAGSKIICNIGKLFLYGQKRGWHITRLTKAVSKGDLSITIAPGLDIVEGDRLALAATSFKHDASDEITVKTYDAGTGKVEFATALKFYHYGAAESTGGYFNGVDMRGEVSLLSRNLKIIGTDVDSFGGQILTADIMELDGRERQGTTEIDSIEFENGGQKDTRRAAVRFENAIATKLSFVRNSAFHNSWGWGLMAKRSNNIDIENNVFYNFRPVGLGLDDVKNVKINGNIVMHVLERDTIEKVASSKFIDKMGGLLICSLDGELGSCRDIEINNNIVAGSVHLGMTAPSEACGATKKVASGNRIHSIAEGANGTGVMVYPGWSATPKCYQVSGWAAYKCTQLGVLTAFAAQKVIMTDITCIDNGKGCGAMVHGEDEMQLKDFGTEVSDSIFYGDFADSSDCPPDGSFCYKLSKGGIYVGSSGVGTGIILHPGDTIPLPNQKKAAKSGGWNVQSIYKNLRFKGLNKANQSGLEQNAIFTPAIPDYIPLTHFQDCTFEDVQGDGSFVKLKEPEKKWANIADCGEFPCTGPKNTLLHFTGTKYIGPAFPLEDKPEEFQIAPDVPGYTELFDTCKPKPEWNAYLCNNRNLGILLFESEDADSWDRSVQPVYVNLNTDIKVMRIWNDFVDGETKVEGLSFTKLNSYMDHVWDGFYTGQLRQSRFPALIDGKKGKVYDLVFTGTPPKEMKFSLKTISQDTGVTIRIAYPGAESRAILKDGVEIEYNQWDEALRNYGPVKQETCGENRYLGVINILEFYIVPGCDLQIKPRDAIQTLVRMEWTLDDFFSEANGGQSGFVDRLTASLGIHASTVKVVSVYEGSLAVNYELSASKEETRTIEEIQALQTEKFATGKVDLGAPLLDVVIRAPPRADGVPVEAEALISDGVVTAVGFPAIVITATGTNTFAKFLWAAVEISTITAPSQMFMALMKETMQFVLGKNFAPGYVQMDEEAVDTTPSTEEGTFIEL